MIFVQAGTGFSFTSKDEGYARDESDVARDLYKYSIRSLFYK